MIVLTVARIDAQTETFFFSSTRRHTRFDCDWSSDVCSSDLRNLARYPAAPRRHHPGRGRAARPDPRHWEDAALSLGGAAGFLVLAEYCRASQDRRGIRL